MQICPPNEEKWVLCASKSEDYQSWCLVLEKFVKEKAMFVPDSSGMPPVNYASDDEGYRSSASFVSGGSTPEAFAAYIASETAKLAKVIRAANIKLE